MDINLQRGLNIDCYLMSSEHFKKVIFITKTNSQITHHGGKKAALLWTLYEQMFTLSQIN